MTVLSSFDRFMASRFSAPDPGHVIVADPDEATFAMVRQLTAPDVWRLSYASSGFELVRQLRSACVRLVIVDLSLVESDPELAEDLVARSRRGLAVVVTTAEHSEQIERRARLLGPVYYAPKPLNIMLLNQVLDGALSAAG
jgi:CheY-like chemotaxis protein